jgi:hypothetical protein
VADGLLKTIHICTEEVAGIEGTLTNSSVLVVLSPAAIEWGKVDVPMLSGANLMSPPSGLRRSKDVMFSR